MELTIDAELDKDLTTIKQAVEGLDFQWVVEEVKQLTPGLRGYRVRLERASESRRLAFEIESGIAYEGYTLICSSGSFVTMKPVQCEEYPECFSILRFLASAIPDGWLYDEYALLLTPEEHNLTEADKKYLFPVSASETPSASTSTDSSKIIFVTMEEINEKFGGIVAIVAAKPEEREDTPR